MTGYRTFEYAHKAIALGVFAFLLKPTNPDDIKNIVQKAVNELNEQSSAKTDIAQLQNENTQYKSIFIEKTISDAINFRLSENDDINTLLRSASSELKSYCLISIFIENISKQLDIEKSEKIKKVISDNLIGKTTPYLIYPDLQKNVVTIVLTSSDILNNYYLSTPAEKINSRLSSLFSTKTSIGISSSSTDFNELKKKHQESIRALEQKQYTGDGSIVFFSDLSTPNFMENYTNHLQQTLFDYVLSGNTEAMKQTLNTISENISKNDIDYARSFCYDTIVKLYSAAEQLLSYLHFDESTASLKSMIYSCNNPQELVSLLCDITYDMTDKIHDLNNALVMYTINKIKSYIAEHYTQQITRQSIAAHIGVTPNYISTLFKKSTGSSLVSYITQYRIDKAKELLSVGKHKHTEISSMVGFKDSFYFSKSFKKITGMTPSEYQKKQLDLNNSHH